MIVLFEGLAMSFWLLLVCVVGISNGAVGLVCLYEKDVRDRAVELGLITEERMKKNASVAGVSLRIPMLIGVPVTVYCINGANGFLDGFVQMLIIYMTANLFDRLFIDVYWVGHTKAWLIPGTEDLMPYIPLKVHVKKWVGTIIGFTGYAALAAWAVSLIM